MWNFGEGFGRDKASLCVAGRKQAVNSRNDQVQFENSEISWSRLWCKPRTALIPNLAMLPSDAVKCRAGFKCSRIDSKQIAGKVVSRAAHGAPQG